jgi:hypothetical protein
MSTTLPLPYTAGTAYTSIQGNTQSSYFKLPAERNEMSRGAVSGTNPSQKAISPALLHSVFFVFPVATHRYRIMKFSDVNYMEMASVDVDAIM